MLALLLLAAMVPGSGPVPVYQPEPDYPAAALEHRIQGVVKLTALIDEDGRVARVHVVSGHPLLAPAALEAVRQWRYRPAMRRGEPVPAPVVITVPFRLPSVRRSWIAPYGSAVRTNHWKAGVSKTSAMISAPSPSTKMGALPAITWPVAFWRA